MIKNIDDPDIQSLLLERITRCVGVGVAIISREYKTVWANEIIKGMFGENLENKHCYSTYNQREDVCADCGVKKVFETGASSVTHEQEGKDADGNLVWSQIIASPIFAEDGTIESAVEVVMPITERKIVEDELRKINRQLRHSQNLMHHVISHARSAIAVHDRNLNYVYVSDRYLEEYGLKKENIIGKHHYEIFPDLPQKWRDVHQRCLKGDVLSSAEDSYPREDGSVEWTRWECRPWYESDGSVGGIIVYTEVITEQKRQQEEKLKMQAQLQQNAKLQAVGTLAGGIAHDFNNILTALLGNLNLSLFDKDLKDSTRKFLSEAEKATLRGKNLTQQLLTLSKGGEPVTEISSLEDVIRESAGFVLSGDSSTCCYCIPEDLWLVDIDKGQISQVIQNIVLNASHAMPGGGTISITCANVFSRDEQSNAPLLEEGKYVKIMVQDQGIGIPANVIDKIFDPYFSTKQKGNGLGLAIVKSIINKHKGSISVASSPGVGSTFMIYLLASETLVINRPDISENLQAASNARILIMDDEEQIRELLKTMLTRSGHEVVTAENGEEAIRLYMEATKNNNDFDLVVMDLTIPGGMGGEKAVKEIHTINPEAKVVVSSGYSSHPIMADFKDYGFCAAVLKPYQYEDLTTAINSILQ